jgi:glutathione S-transferase
VKSSDNKNTILPRDAVGRAKARFFIDMVDTKFLPTWYGVFFQKDGGGSFDAFMDVIEEMQRLMSSEGEYVMGKEFTIADICLAPSLGMIWVALENDFGKYGVGEGRKVYEKLNGEEKYERIRRYVDKIRERESFKSTFEKVSELRIPIVELEMIVGCAGVFDRGDEGSAWPTMNSGILTTYPIFPARGSACTIQIMKIFFS